jgi:hypothetical protein
MHASLLSRAPLYLSLTPTEALLSFSLGSLSSLNAAHFLITHFLRLIPA